MTEFHAAKACSREEPRIELIDTMLKSLLDLVELEYRGEPVRVDGFRLRNLEDWRTADETSLQQNLGSLSTVCNCRCTFCYEDGNPDGLFEKEPRFVGLAEARTRLRHLHDGKGLFRESKGFFEPLTNPEYLSLLRLMRQQDPEHVIDVTTNGALLTQQLVSELSALKPVYVNLSLISADAATRRAVTKDGREGYAIAAVNLLREARIPFMGTLVPWPSQGLEDVTKTIEYLDSHEARLIRISMPGLTRHHPRYEPGLIEPWLEEIVQHVRPLQKRIRTPLLISPFAYVSTSLDPRVEGVIASSPAAEAGVMVGDTIESVDGTEIVSRSHATSLLGRATELGSTEIDLLRDGARLSVRLSEPPVEREAYPYKPEGYRPLKFPGLSFGVCLPSSFHLQYIKQIHDAIRTRSARRILIAVSPFYRDLVESLLKDLPLPDGAEVELIVPENRFFGGNVCIGDLWVVDDIVEAVRRCLASTRESKADLLLLPSSFLSQWGRDLRGVHYRELEVTLDIEVALIKCARIVL